MQGEAAPPLSVPHRLAILYLMLPLMIWLVGWFQWWFGIPIAAVIALGLWRALSGSWRVSFRPTAFVLLLLAAGWVMMTAAVGGFETKTFDWDKHRAIFLDLSIGDWPTYLPTYLDSPALLRYYLGYYLVPSLSAKLFGVAALNWLVPLWTWFGVALMLLLFTRGHRGWLVIGAALILVLFSGIDTLRIALLQGEDWLRVSVDTQGWTWLWLGQWSAWAESVELPNSYYSHMASLMWAPQHFIPGVLYVLLLLQLHREPRFLSVSGILLATSLFWSPFVALALLPLVVALLFANGIRPLLQWQNLLLAIPIAGLLTAYLTSGPITSLPSGWIWTVYSDAWPRLLREVPVIYITKFLLLATLIVLLRPSLIRDPFLIAGLIPLFLLPWLSYGKYNDLLLRGTIPSLALLSYYCATAFAGPGVKGNAKRGLHLLVLGALGFLLLVGAVTPLSLLANAINDRNTGLFDFGVYRYRSVALRASILQVTNPQLHSQYAVYDVPAVLRRLLRESGGDLRRLDRGERIAQSRYDVYLFQDRLVYIREQCQVAEEDSSFIVHVFPLNREDLPGRAHSTRDFDFRDYGWRAGDTCLAIRLLPPLTIGRIRTGQSSPSRPQDSWLSDYYTESYKSRLLEEAGEPLLRSQFTVYRHGHLLIYVKEPCSQADTDARILLHTVPVDPRDLWNKRDQREYDVLDFEFSEFGERREERCIAIRAIPDYAIKEIRTGQYGVGDSLLWEGTVTLDE